ncbi:Pyrophosphate-energized vacuolar membrane proton pump, partial [Diplonema papillatum]
REEYPCRFEVPYVAVLAAAAVCFACCGASCFEGYSVLCRWLGGDALRSARLLVRGEVVRVYMGQGTVFLCAAAALFAFLFVGLDQHGEGTHNPVYCTCFLVGGVATWLAAEAASLMAAEAAGRLAAWGYEGTPTPEGCFWLESRVARRGALAAALGASAAVLAGFAAVYVGFSDAVGLLAFALGSATAAFCLRLAAATAGAAAEGAQGLLAAGAGAERCGLPFAFQGGVRARSADAASPAAATGGTPPDSRILLSPGSPLRARSPSSRGFHTPYPNPAPGCEDAVVASGRGGELGPLSGRGACYVVRPPAPRPAATAAGGLGPLSGRGECSVVRPPAPGPAANAGDAWEPAGAALRLAGGGAGAAAGLLCSCVTAAAAACLLGAPEFGRDGVGLPFSVAAVGLGSSAVATGFFYRRAGDALPDATRRKAVLASAAVHVAVSAAVVVPYFGGIADTGLSGNQDHPGPRLYGCVALGAVLACAVQLGAEIHTAPALLPQRSARELLDRGLAAGILQGLGIGSVAGACHSILSAGIVIATYYLAGFFGTAVASCSMMSMLVAPMTAAELSSLAESSYSMCVMAGMSPLGDDRAAQMLQLRSYSRTASAAAEAYAEVGLWISSVSLVVAFGRASGCDGVAAFKPVVIFGLLAGLSFPHLLTSLLVWGVFDVSRDINHKVRAGLSYLVTGRFIPVSVLMARSALRAFGPLVVVACVPFLLGFTFGARSLFAFLAGGVTTALLSGLSGGATGSLMPDAGSTKPTRESAFFGTSLRNVAAPSLALATAMAVCLAVLAAPLFGTGAQHFAFGLAVLIMGLFAIVTWEAVMLRRHERNGGSATGISGFD